LKKAYPKPGMSVVPYVMDNFGPLYVPLLKRLKTS
jgi:hypothetical protein